MKYVARVTKVLHTGIHTVGGVRDGKIETVANLPLPTFVEIELDAGPDGPCMFYRYTDDGQFCGDTWHQTLADAFEAAAFEYGLTENDFKEVPK
ncbi:MAG TPA: hypothetical protein VGP72_18355 [Planctomycetota bacterium]|jgi:hypothetical protein